MLLFFRVLIKVNTSYSLFVQKTLYSTCIKQVDKGFLRLIRYVRLNQTNGAEDGGRTRTMVTHRRILSPVRLPIPPPRHNKKKLWWALQDSNL